MTKVFNELKEIQKYYDEETNTYVFKENDHYIDLVVFDFDLNIKANINAWDIKAQHINALDIYAMNIYAFDIDAIDIDAIGIEVNDIIARDIDVSHIIAQNIQARNITYNIICFAYNNIKCKSIKGLRQNSKHFVLGGKLEVENGQ